MQINPTHWNAIIAVAQKTQHLSSPLQDTTQIYAELYAKKQQSQKSWVLQALTPSGKQREGGGGKRSLTHGCTFLPLSHLPLCLLCEMSHGPTTVWAQEARALVSQRWVSLHTGTECQRCSHLWGNRSLSCNEKISIPFADKVFSFPMFEGKAALQAPLIRNHEANLLGSSHWGGCPIHNMLSSTWQCRGCAKLVFMAASIPFTITANGAAHPGWDKA